MKTEAFIQKFQRHEEFAKSSKIFHEAEQKKSKESSDGDRSFLCTSFDLQKVLNTPHGKSTTLYYSRKYFMYNETFMSLEHKMHIVLSGVKKTAKEVPMKLLPFSVNT